MYSMVPAIGSAREFPKRFVKLVEWSFEGLIKATSTG